MVLNTFRYNDDDDNDDDKMITNSKICRFENKIPANANPKH